MAMVTLAAGKRYLKILKYTTLPTDPLSGFVADEFTEAQEVATAWVRSQLHGVFDTTGWTTPASTPSLARSAADQYASWLVLTWGYLKDSAQKDVDEAAFPKLLEAAERTIGLLKEQPVLFLDSSTTPIERIKESVAAPQYTAVRPDFPEEAGQVFRQEHEVPGESEAELEDQKVQLYER